MEEIVDENEGVGNEFLSGQDQSPQDNDSAVLPGGIAPITKSSYENTGVQNGESESKEGMHDADENVGYSPVLQEIIEEVESYIDGGVRFHQAEFYAIVEEILRNNLEFNYAEMAAFPNYYYWFKNKMEIIVEERRITESLGIQGFLELKETSRESERLAQLTKLKNLFDNNMRDLNIPPMKSGYPTFIGIAQFLYRFEQACVIEESSRAESNEGELKGSAVFSEIA